MLDATWSAIRDKFYGNVPLFDIAKEFNIKAPVIQGFLKAYEIYILNPDKPEPTPKSIKYEVDWEGVKAAFLASMPKREIKLFFGPTLVDIKKYLEAQGFDTHDAARNRSYSEAIRLYQTGLSLLKIEEQTGIPSSTLRIHLKKQGVRLRTEKGKGNAAQARSLALDYGKRTYENLPWESIELEFGKGASVSTLGKKYGIHPKTMSRYLKLRGIQISERWEHMQVKFDQKYAAILQGIQWPELKAQYDNGFSWTEIASGVGLPVSRLRREFDKRFKIKARTALETMLLRKRQAVEGWPSNQEQFAVGE